MLYYIIVVYLLLIVWSSLGVYRVGNRTACTRTQSSVCVLWVTLPEIIHRIPGDTWFIRKRTDYTGWIIIILYLDAHISLVQIIRMSYMILHYYNIIEWLYSLLLLLYYIILIFLFFFSGFLSKLSV